MKTLYKSFSILFLTLLIADCSKNNEDSIPNPSELQAYLDRFLDEAEQLGKTYDVSKLDLRFVNEQIQGKYCGYGYTNYNNSGRQRIEIFNSEGCWAGHTDLEKENLFFHEIGHALLGRPHTEEELPNSLPKSLMCSECNNYGVYNEYQLHRRDYYIRDLILLNPLLPEWGQLKSNYQTYYDDIFSSEAALFFGSSDPAVEHEKVSPNVDFPEGGLMIGSKSTLSSSSANWGLRFDNPQIADHSTLKLEVKLKSLETIEGKGLSFALRTNKTEGSDINLISFVTTQGKLDLTGDLNQTVEIQLPDYVSSSDYLYVFCIYLTGTKGQAIIENIKLSYAED